MSSVAMMNIMLSMCIVESGGRANAINLEDPTVAVGFCQLRKIAARDVGYKGNMMGLLDKKTNFQVASKYLSKQLKRYEGKVYCAIKAYNAGFCKTNEPNDYVRKVIKAHTRMFGRGF